MPKAYPLVLAALPSLIIRAAGVHFAPPLEALISGTAILAAAFLLLWACDAAQADISQALALAVVSLIAVLPEYAVDMYFTWQAGQDPNGGYAQYAIANMTGANRLIIVVGWAAIAFISWLRFRRPVLMEQEQPVAGVSAHPYRPELARLGEITRAGDQKQLDPKSGHLALTAGWGHAGKGGVTMPGSGRANERDYQPDELAAITAGAAAQGLDEAQALDRLGATCLDVHLNGAAYWRSVPAKVWPAPSPAAMCSRNGSPTASGSSWAGTSAPTRRAISAKWPGASRPYSSWARSWTPTTRR